MLGKDFSTSMRFEMAQALRSGVMPPRTKSSSASQPHPRGSMSPRSATQNVRGSSRSRASSHNGRFNPATRSSAPCCLPAHEVDRTAVLEFSQQTTDELTFKTREKEGLLRLQRELKHRSQVLDAKHTTTRTKVDKVVAQAAQYDERAASIATSNIVLHQDVEGLKRDNVKMKEEIDQLTEALAMISLQLLQERKSVEDLSRIKIGCQKELQMETKSRGHAMQNIRATATAHALLSERLTHAQRQSMAIRQTVSTTVG